MLTTNKCIHINHINCSSLALESKLASTAQLSAVAMHSTPRSHNKQEHRQCNYCIGSVHSDGIASSLSTSARDLPINNTHVEQMKVANTTLTEPKHEIRTIESFQIHQEHFKCNHTHFDIMRSP